MTSPGPCRRNCRCRRRSGPTSPCRWPPRGPRHEHADHPDGARRAHARHEVVDGRVRDLVALGIVGLPAHRLDAQAAPSPPCSSTWSTAGPFESSMGIAPISSARRRRLAWRSTRKICSGALDLRAQRRHQPDGPAAEDHTDLLHPRRCQASARSFAADPEPFSIRARCVSRAWRNGCVKG